MATLDTARFEQAMDQLDADREIFSNFLTGSADLTIPVEGGELMTLKGVEERLLKAELDANEFIINVSEKMDSVSEPTVSDGTEEQ